jgi:hypothetical protein
MQTLNLHDRGAIEERVAAMGAETLAAMVERRKLSALAESVAMEELARRVVADDVDYGPAARGEMTRILDRASNMLVALLYAAWFASVLVGIVG